MYHSFIHSSVDENSGCFHVLANSAVMDTVGQVSKNLTLNTSMISSYVLLLLFSGSVPFSSATQSCPASCDCMDCSRPSFPVLHHLPEFVQTHVHEVSDAIQPSHPLSSPSPPAFSLSQHQGLF